MISDLVHGTGQGESGGRTFCPARNRRFVLISAILASGMGFIDGSVVAIAIPAMRGDLDASLSDAQWISNAYLLFLSSLIMIGGAAGDRFGLRRVFALGISVFTAASALCAIAPDAVTLIAARAVQGIAAAFMVPGSLAIIAKAYPADERGRAIGTWAAFSAMTTALGPVAGGFLLSLLGDWSWRLIFALNVPLGVFTLYLLWFRVPADRAIERRGLDVTGGALVTVCLLLLAWGLTGEGGEGSAPGGERALFYGGLSLVALVVFLFWERSRSAPMVPLSLFANRVFSGANLLTFLLYFSLSAVMFYLPMTLISAWGINEAEVSAIFLPISLSIALLSGLSGRIADSYGPKPILTAGCAVVGIAFAGLAMTMHLQAFWTVVFPLMVIMGIGMALVVSPLSTAVMTSVSDDDTGIASGLNNAISRVAGLVAVAAMGGVALLAFQSALGDAGGQLTAFGEKPIGPVSAAADAARIAASNIAFSAIATIVALMSFAAALVSFATQRGAREPDPRPAE